MSTENKDNMNTEGPDTQLMPVLKRFSGGVAHDLNNLLTGILGYTILAFEDLKEEDGVYPYLKEIENSAVRARELSGKLVLLSRKREPKKVPGVDVAGCVESALEDLRSVYPEVSFVKEDTGGLPDITADADHMLLAVKCLIAAAASRTKKKGRAVIRAAALKAGADQARKYPFLKREREYVLVNALAEGVRFSEQDIADALKPVYTTSRDPLLGCEMAVVSEIASAHGGGAAVSLPDDRTGVVLELFLPV